MSECECHCGRPERGWVGAEQVGEQVTPPHRCRQCSPEHCELASHARRCQFALCSRDQEVEVTLSADLAWRVCGLHIAPVLTWGVTEVSEVRIRNLLDDRAA